MGRRVEKTHAVHDGQQWVTQSVQRFVYDEWNVVLVLDDNNDVVRKYTWGLDLSRTVHGAGGIGGLLAAVETQGTSSTNDDQHYWFFYDANGNVGQVLKASDQSIAARYEYGPYGNVIGPDDDNDGEWQDDAGPYASANPIRFSTKWFDTELPGNVLIYYGYRYYSPRLGRWLNRDPIEETGGVHLYACVRNSPVNSFDPLGLVDPPSNCDCVKYWGIYWLECTGLSNGYCADSALGGALHLGSVCFREITPDCGPSKHICCSCDRIWGTLSCEEHTDSHGPAEGANEDGTCNYSCKCTLLHWWHDL